jgi:hypothetical protein
MYHLISETLHMRAYARTHIEIQLKRRYIRYMDPSAHAKPRPACKSLSTVLQFLGGTSPTRL